MGKWAQTTTPATGAGHVALVDRSFADQSKFHEKQSNVRFSFKVRNKTCDEKVSSNRWQPANQEPQETARRPFFVQIPRQNMSLP
jgi:hypothetical protein